MSQKWPQLGDNRPASWHMDWNAQLQDAALTRPKTGSTQFSAGSENNENDENDGQTSVSVISELVPQQPGRARQRHSGDRRRAAPPALPLHERSASEDNRLKEIRVVPYTPPRLDSQQEVPQSALLPQGQASSASPNSSQRRRRRQRQRRRRSKDRDSHDGNNLSDDSDQTTATASSRRASRPTSLASRGSWGPSAILAEAGGSASSFSASARASPVSPVPTSPGSRASSSRTVVAGGSSISGAKKGKAKNEGHVSHPVLSEKSQNVVMGGGRRAITTKSEFGAKLNQEDYTDSRPGSALSASVQPVFPLTRGGRQGVSGAKLASPTSSLFTSASMTTAPNATADTPPAVAVSTAKNTNSPSSPSNPSNTSNPSDITSFDATTPYLLAHSQHEPWQEQHQQQPQWSGHDSYDSDDVAPVPAPPSRPRNFLGLTPASASFSAAAASYLSEHRSAPGAAQLQLPSSLSASYENLPLPTTLNTVLPTRNAAPSLSPSPSVASLTSVSSSQAAPRPNSRRRNLVAVHSDKTFSLLPRSGEAGSSSSGLYVHSDHAPPASVATTISNLKSPRFSSASTTFRSSGSHDRLFSEVFSGDDHPSSISTNSATVQEDRSSLSPFTPSPGSSVAKFTTDLVAAPVEPLFSSAASDNLATGTPNHTSSWNYWLAGGLRKVPRTPDSKRKGKGRAVPSPSTSPYSQKHHTAASVRDVSILISLPESSPGPATTTAAGGSPVDTSVRLAVSRPRRKTSSASDQSAGGLSTDSVLSFTASTVSAKTNYKVYAHSSSPAGAASPSLARESTGSFGLLPSSSHSANIEILGVSSPAAPPLPVLQRSDDPNQTFASLASYPSFASFDTGLSESSAPNFVILGASSPPAPSRYLDHLRSDEDESFAADTDIPSSPPLPPRSANTTTGSFNTNDSDPNYILHGEPSTVSLPPQSASSNASSLVTVSRQPRPVYSQESLVVPPLKTVRAKRSNEKFGYYKSRSRESLRRAASIKSISSIFGQEAYSTFFAGQAFLSLDIPPIPVFTANKSSLKTQHQLPASSSKQSLPKLKRKPLPLPAPAVQSENYVVYDRTPNKKADYRSSVAWDSPLSSSQLSSSPPSPSPSPSLPQQPKLYKQPTVQMIEEHPHQWSSQLSTVMSESEVESAEYRTVSRSLSAVSGAPSGSYVRGDASAFSGRSAGRRSSTGWASSTHSRNLPSISSSLGLQPDELRERNSRGDSILLDRPNHASFRTSTTSQFAAGSSGPASPPACIVRDHDEDGDGLADLQDVRRQPSRSGLSGFFSSTSGSARNLHSSASMRSVASGVFPSWARVYYGSGEHRPLSGAPSMSDIGQGDDYMTGAARPNSAFHRRPREVQQDGYRPFSDAAGMEAGDAGIVQDYRLRATGMRRITSSIWSPHLQVDRRATGFAVWQPPSVTWTTNTNATFDRRNLQVMSFIIGFIFPFAWMIAAFLPLPLDPKRAMEKRPEGEYGVPSTLKQRVAQNDEKRYQSARWWRNLNRIMAVFGLLIIGAVVALVVVGVRQGW